MLLTSLSTEGHASERIFDAYRDHWQIEIGFKRLKTLGQLHELPSSDPVLARTWLLAHLIAAVLTDDLANEIASFPPEPGERQLRLHSLWRAWKKAREILLAAILPRLALRRRGALRRFRRRLEEAPTQDSSGSSAQTTVSSRV